MSAELALQTAVYQALNGNISVPVFDFVQQEYAGQYVVIGDDTTAELDTDLTTGFDCTLTLHVWDTDDTTAGRAACKSVMGEVRETLDRASLNVSGYTSTGVQFEFSQTMLDPDNTTIHGVLRMRVTLREE